MEKAWSLKGKASQLPDLPGVYLMKDAGNEVIYCGKAGSLKKRVGSYFIRSHNLDPRRALLAAQVQDFEYIVTNSEFEALILESNLIKIHKPRFNVLLRDDKQYPYLCITTGEAFPRLKVVRRIRKDKCLYFGPYTPAKAMRGTLRLIHQIFPVRKCSSSLNKNLKRPCLNYQMGLCCAPCAGFVSQEKYNSLVKEIILFLQGKKDDLVMHLKREMEEAASQQRFESAARFRDQIRAVLSCMEKQRVLSSSDADQDYIAFARYGELAYVQVFFIRFGKMTGRKTLSLSNVQDIPDEELMGTILKQFYEDDKAIPPVILVHVMPDEAQLIERWLSEKRGGKVKLLTPQRGEKRELMMLAQKNAALGAMTSPTKGSEVSQALIMQAQKDLSLKKAPYRIEGFDISNLGQSEAVGSMVYWENAKPVKSRYRRFKIKDNQMIDDYGMMAEVIKRRYIRLKNEKERMPDLILIDGGKGHLAAGIRALAELGITEIPVVSLAKREELIFIPESDSPLDLPKRSPTLQLLQRIRDEAHRFALTYQKVRRNKRAFSSILDNIPGIGPKRKEELLKHFLGIDRIKKASVEDILTVPTIDRKTAEKIYRHFHY